MKKIRITITMTEQEAEWLEQACFIEEDYPHSKFLNRVSRLARRARHAFQQPRAADGLVRCKKCNALIETTVHCDNCGTFEPTRR